MVLKVSSLDQQYQYHLPTIRKQILKLHSRYSKLEFTTSRMGLSHMCFKEPSR